MGIIGLTVDKQGAPIIRQAVTHKLVIGRGPNSAGNPGNAPKKLDHIAFMRKNAEGKWVDDDELTNFYKSNNGGQPVRAVEIVLFDNDIEQVFRSSYMAYVKRGCWCKGDGEKAERRDLGKDNKGWGPFSTFTGPCANGGCPFPEQKKCKPMGTLQFSLMAHLKLGSVCKIQTTGKQSIAQIYSALETLRRMTGGVIKGIPIKLFVQPDRALYIEQGQAKTGSKFVWGLEVNARDFQEMRRQLTAGPRQFYEILQLGQGTILDVEEEDEEDVAEEVTGEFGYEVSGGPASRQKPEEGSGATANTSATPRAADLNLDDLRDEAEALLTQMGRNRAYRHAELGKYQTAEAMQKFIDQLKEEKPAKQKGQQSQDTPRPTPAGGTSQPSAAKPTRRRAAEEQAGSGDREETGASMQEEDPFLVSEQETQQQQPPKAKETAQPNFKW